MSVIWIKEPIADDFSIPPDASHVQFCRQLGAHEYEVLATRLRDRSEVTLRVFDSREKVEFTNLDFLAYFPTIRRLSIELFYLDNIDGFCAIGDLEDFGFATTHKKTYSLDFIRRFRSIRKLWLEGQQKDIEVIASLPHLRTLTLRSTTLPGIDFLSATPELDHLEIKLGGTTNLQALAELNLKYLELWLIRGLSDVSFIAGIESLESLVLQALKNVKKLPSLRKLTKLRDVRLETMKGLTNICPLAEAPALERLMLVDMPTIDPKSLSCFRGHPSLKEFGAGLGSLKRNAYAEALLGLPPCVWLPPGMREKAALTIMSDAAKRSVN